MNILNSRIPGGKKPVSNLNRLLTALSGKDYGSYLITSLSDIGWLTGFTGSAAYVLISDKPYFITDFRYELAVKELLSPEWEIVIAKSYNAYLVEALSGKKLTFQKSVSYADYRILSDLSEDASVEDDTLSSLRAVKTEAEIIAVKAQYALAADAFKASLIDFNADASEREWAARLEYNMKKLGANSPSFPTIIASGARGALPHGEPTEKIISENDTVVVDFGSKKLYTSDYTRLLCKNARNGKVSETAKIVKEAVDAAKEKVKPGVTAGEIDKAARSVIERFGYGDFFNHSTGHGVGVDVHENPTIRAGCTEIILEGMIFTIEPGIYLPGEFGVRLEDTVLVTANGYENLSRLDDYVYSFN
jgi:Xaa-Pro aminopeptidase